MKFIKNIDKYKPSDYNGTHMIKESDLDFWITNNLNVLLEGKAGVGKTEIIKKSFTKHFGTRWRYFSASTMDPWTDLVGVPKENKDTEGNIYLDFIRPKEFAKDEVEAIFCDEFNRSPKKVKNSLMELIQFKSINGKKYNNLKVVWAAINPVDDKDHTYDVEEMDTAQKDRFHIYVEMPYGVDSKYFKEKYGEQGKVACDWWGRLSKDQKNIVSPRRLDYCLDVFNRGGDINYVLPKQVSVNELITNLSVGDIGKKLKDLLSSKDREGTVKLFNNSNALNMTLPIIKKMNSEGMGFFLPVLRDVSPDRLSALFNEDSNVRNFIIQNPKEFEVMLTFISSSRGSWQKAAQAAIQRLNPIVQPLGISNVKPVDQTFVDKSIKDQVYMTCTTNGSNKYWRAFIRGTLLTTQWGPIGVFGGEKNKSYTTYVSAKNEYDKMVRQKIAKGYIQNIDPNGLLVNSNDNVMFLAFESNFNKEWNSNATYQRKKIVENYLSITAGMNNTQYSSERLSMLVTMLLDFQQATIKNDPTLFSLLKELENIHNSVGNSPTLSRHIKKKLTDKFFGDLNLI